MKDSTTYLVMALVSLAFLIGGIWLSAYLLHQIPEGDWMRPPLVITAVIIEGMLAIFTHAACGCAKDAEKEERK